MRYALIDNHSGYVWWVGEADSPMAACKTADDEIGPRPGPTTYEERFRPDFSNETGYHVHEVPSDFDVSDGQNKQEIEAAVAFPRVAYVRVVSGQS